MSARAEPGGRLFWAGMAVGWAIMGFGIWGALGIAEDTHPRSLLIWILACLFVHDAVIAPAVFTIGSTMRRTLPLKVRRLVRTPLYISGVLVLLSIPVIGGYGMRRDNPTLLPRNYEIGLLVAVVTVWVVSIAVLLLAARRHRHP